LLALALADFRCLNWMDCGGWMGDSWKELNRKPGKIVLSRDGGFGGGLKAEDNGGPGTGGILKYFSLLSGLFARTTKLHHIADVLTILPPEFLSSFFVCYRIAVPAADVFPCCWAIRVEWRQQYTK